MPERGRVKIGEQAFPGKPQYNPRYDHFRVSSHQIGQCRTLWGGRGYTLCVGDWSGCMGATCRTRNISLFFQLIKKERGGSVRVTLYPNAIIDHRVAFSVKGKEHEYCLQNGSYFQPTNIP